MTFLTDDLGFRNADARWDGSKLLVVAGSSAKSASLNGRNGLEARSSMAAVSSLETSPSRLPAIPRLFFKE